MPLQNLYVKRSPAKVSWMVMYGERIITTRDKLQQAVVTAIDLSKKTGTEYTGVSR
jgi:hypothetical protein